MFEMTENFSVSWNITDDSWRGVGRPCDHRDDLLRSPLQITTIRLNIHSLSFRIAVPPFYRLRSREVNM